MGGHSRTRDQEQVARPERPAEAHSLADGVRPNVRCPAVDQHRAEQRCGHRSCARPRLGGDDRTPRGTIRRRPRRSGRLGRGRWQVDRCTRAAGELVAGSEDVRSSRSTVNATAWASSATADATRRSSPSARAASPADRDDEPIPVTSANAAISPSTASAPAPGSAKITIPKTIATRPVRIINAVSRPSSDSRNDAPTHRIPNATAYAPITYRSASAEMSGQAKTSTPTMIPRRPQDQPRAPPPLRGERSAELEDARRERVGAEQDRERVDADVGPGENHHAEHDGRQAVQAERPPHLRDLRPPDLRGAVEHRFHLLPPFRCCQLHDEACGVDARPMPGPPLPRVDAVAMQEPRGGG